MRNLLKLLTLGLALAATPLGLRTASADPTLPTAGAKAVTANPTTGALTWPSGDLAAFRSSMGLAIGSNVQAYDADLAAFAALSSAADKLPYFTGTGTASVTDFTSFARSMAAAADAAAARTTLGVVIGTDVQAYNANLAALAGLTSAADRLPYFTGSGTASHTPFSSFARSLLGDGNATAARNTLGVVIGTNVQAYDADLTTLAASSAFFLGLSDDADATALRDSAGASSGVWPVALGGTGVSALPTVSARPSADQTVATATLTKVSFGTEEWDNTNAFASSTFTPLKPGKYRLNALTKWSSNGAYSFVLYARKSGGSYFMMGQGQYTPTVSGNLLMELNGSTDYVEIFCVQYSGGDLNIEGAAGQTVFQAEWAAP